MTTHESYLEPESPAGLYITSLFSFVYKEEISKHDDLHERSTTWYHSSAFVSAAKVLGVCKGIGGGVDFDSAVNPFSRAVFIIGLCPYSGDRHS